MQAFEQFQTTENNSAGLGSKKEFLTVLGIFLAIFLLLFSPVLFTGQLLAPDDGFVQNLPNFFGKRSLWSLSIYSGYPLMADPLVQYFYPLPIILSHLPQGWNIYILSGYILSGSFLYLYLRLLTGSFYASLCGGIFYALSGYLMCETLHVHVVQTAMWFALLLTLFELLARRMQGRWPAEILAGGSLAICLCTLNGHFQTLAYMLGVLALYAPLRASALTGKKERLKYIGIAWSILALGLGLAACQLLPTAELAAFSAREKFTFQDFLTYDMHPLESLGVFLPFLFGGAPDGIISQPYFATFVCPPHFLYVGYIPLFLAPVAACAFVRNRLVLFWALSGLITFLLAFGDATPLASLLYHIKPFGSFRCLHRILLVSALANSILAALAIAATEKGKIPRPILMASSVSLALFFCGMLFTVSTLKGVLSGQAIRYGIEDLGVLPWTNPAIGCSTVIFALSLVALICFASQPRRQWSRVFLATVAVFDLAFLGWYAQGGQWRLKSAPMEKTAAPALAQKYVPLADREKNRILTVRGGSATFDELPNNICRLWGVPSASGYEPLMLSRYGSLLNISEGGFLFPSWQYTAADRCFDILSIKYATTAADDNRLEGLVDGKGRSAWNYIEDIGTAGVHENRRLLPRCWLAPKAIKLSDDDILKAVKTSVLPGGGQFDPVRTALLEQEVEIPGRTNSYLIIKGGDKATIKALTDDYMRVEIWSATGYVLVTSDIFYPWWRATLDGQDTKILRADYVLRAVVVPAGHHIVEFKLHPGSLYIGLTVSALAALAMLTGRALLARNSALPPPGDVGKSL